MVESEAGGNALYTLGLDFGTQSVKVLVLDVRGAGVVHTDSFEYDTAFPGYDTRGGVLRSDHPATRHTSPFMLLEALDLVFDRLQKSGVDLGLIGAVKIDAMQHCTVYADASFGERVGSLDAGQSLLAQLGTSITRRTSPIWEDRSPVKEAEHLAQELEKHGSIVALTGNRAELRFPAAQILKWAGESPDDYAQTAHIFLLSAFLTSILAGKVAPVDTGDGWGTNLNTLDIRQPGWSDVVLKVADEYLGSRDAGLKLRGRLGEMVDYDTVVGPIAPCFVRRYGVSPRAVVLAGTGDNPATLLGCGGQAVVSLGSSYTVNGQIREIVPSASGEYNVFGYTPGNAMALTVFTNGAKVHEFLLDKYIPEGAVGSEVDDRWEAYVSAAGEAVLPEDERLMLPYLRDESVPLRPSGIVRDGFDDQDARVNIRSLHVSQVLSLKLHSGHLSRTGTLCVVGGAGRNRFLRQLIADVFDSSTYNIRHAGFAAALGCAISGARAVLDISYEEAASRFVQVDKASSAHPLKANRRPVGALLQRYEAMEKSIDARRNDET
jgi:xylulokinase